MISWSDFLRVELRVGTILEVHDFPQAKQPAYQLHIDFEELGHKKSSAQITALYAKEDLVGRQIIAVVNFPPKQIARFFSEVLVTGLVQADGSVVLIGPDRSVQNGLRVG